MQGDGLPTRQRTDKLGGINLQRVREPSDCVQRDVDHLPLDPLKILQGKTSLLRCPLLGQSEPLALDS